MKNLYKSIKMNLKEMSLDIKSIRDRIQEHLPQLLNNLLKCIIIQDTTNNLSHWSDETYSQISEVSKIKGKNKYPTKKQLTDWIIYYYSDVLDNRIKREIDNINYKENANITDYDTNLLKELILNYFNWLISILSVNGSVTNQEVHEKIKELIKEYNKLNI